MRQLLVKDIIEWQQMSELYHRPEIEQQQFLLSRYYGLSMEEIGQIEAITYHAMTEELFRYLESLKSEGGLLTPGQIEEKVEDIKEKRSENYSRFEILDFG